MLIDSTNLVQVLDHNDGVVPVATLGGPMGTLTIQAPNGVVSVPSVVSLSGGGALAGTFTGTPTWSGAHVFQAGLTANGAVNGSRFAANAPITFTTAATSAAFQYAGNISGTISETPTYFSGLSIANDTASTTGVARVFLSQTNLKNNFSGSRTSIHGQMNVAGLPTDAGTGSQFYVAVEGDVFTSANVGGTSPSPAGHATASEFGALLGTGSTFYSAVNGVEVSAGIQSGASAQRRQIVTIEAQAAEAVRGTDFDAGIAFSQDGSTTPGLGYGIAFGSTVSGSFFANDSVLIGGVYRTQGLGGGNYENLLADRGIDLSYFYFTTASLVLPGVTIDATGQTSIANAAINRTSSGVSIDIPHVMVTGAAVAAGGLAYNVGDHVYEATSGTILNVTSVNGSGAITGLAVLVPGGKLAAAPGGPLALTGGDGNGAATVTLTTAARNELSLNPAGGAIKLPLLTNAANDAAAAGAGVAVGQLYRNGSVVMQRVS